MGDLLRIFWLVMKSLFRKPACGMYPFKPANFYKNTRGHVQITPPDCILCTLCDKKCPTHAIKVNREERKWEINHCQCIFCGSCVDHCPTKCLTMVNQYASPAANKSVEAVDIPEKSADKSKN